MNNELIIINLSITCENSSTFLTKTLFPSSSSTSQDFRKPIGLNKGLPDSIINSEEFLNFFCNLQNKIIQMEQRIQYLEKHIKYCPHICNNIAASNPTSTTTTTTTSSSSSYCYSSSFISPTTPSSLSTFPSETTNNFNSNNLMKSSQELFRNSHIRSTTSSPHNSEDSRDYSLRLSGDNIRSESDVFSMPRCRSVTCPDGVSYLIIIISIIIIVISIILFIFNYILSRNLWSLGK